MCTHVYYTYSPDLSGRFFTPARLDTQYLISDVDDQKQNYMQDQIYGLCRFSNLQSFVKSADSDGTTNKEQNAEYIQALFHYMHNLHAQKVSAYRKLEVSLKQQMDLESEIRILKGMVGIPHYALDETNRIELVIT